MEGVIGYITPFAGNFAPRNWATCEGQLLPIAQNTALFSILGTNYGGNGKNTFALPDLRGRAAVSAGQGPGLSFYNLGQMEGNETTALTLSQMPEHTHAINVDITPRAAATASATSPVNGIYANGTEQLFSPSADSTSQPYSVEIAMLPTGQGQPFPILHPVIALNYIICMTGVFPSRN